MATFLYVLVFGSVLLYALFGLIYNFAIMAGWVVYWIWLPIDWIRNRPRRYRARRGLDT